MQTLIARRSGKTGWIRFNRPEVRNAVNSRMIEELEEVWTKWEKDAQLQAVVFYGDGRAFLSGGDIAEFHQRTRKEEIQPIMERMGKLLERIHTSRLVTVAAVEGAAVGGGCEFVASCDFCFASESARFGMIQVNLHITAGWGGASRLMQKIGASRALSMLLSGKILDAQAAYEKGLVDELFKSNSFREETEKLVQSIVKASPEVTRCYKSLANAVRQGKHSDELLWQEADYCTTLWEADIHRKAVEAFLGRTRKK
ncbi:enoyl-CoA hydratase/isomerase family protein [Thermoactinomyces mirandus]|uniref:Enoyl-CoA hydratase/isomerase family protein n=1 Tax=Thermoactinomyces mirandus TaxID=2756294 RepID=A0A7W1XQ15_9BACL|nr:enoyl-CoA hydratase/isomerase family protein [Thermoactinomyces mirandus]MBA4601183.1 enoyl-CoA hydratase/isomerase family protein [Thermoactinomyces mirandus]